MAEIIKGDTANEVWANSVSLICNKGVSFNGRTGDTLEVLHTCFTLKDPKQKWVISRDPPLSIGFALAELVWIMSGDNHSSVINYWNNSLKKYAGAGKKYYGAYGKRIRSRFGFDQLNEAYNALNSNPQSRQVVIQIYDSKTDFPIKNGKPRSQDIPCNVCSILKVRDGHLEWTQIMRSNDLFLGLPYNLIQFTSIQEILAGWLKIQPGTYTHFSDSLHLYTNQQFKIKPVNKRNSNSESLAINKLDSDLIFSEIYKRMKSIASNKMSENKLSVLGTLGSKYSAYNNIMLIIVLYCAHKLGYIDLEKDLLSRCTNDTYRFLWINWAYGEGN